MYTLCRVYDNMLMKSDRMCLFALAEGVISLERARGGAECISADAPTATLSHSHPTSLLSRSMFLSIFDQFGVCDARLAQ